MAKTSGLPEGFDIGATKDDLDDAPVQLGDYLEETLRPSPARKPLPSVPEMPVGPVSDAARVTPQAAPIQHVEMRNDVLQPQPSARAVAQLRPNKQLRLQINLSVEGKNAHDNLMDFMQSRARQRDVKHAEVYQALALALADALPYLDLKAVPERGAWGSPTARSFVTALKAAFGRAIGEHHAAELR